MFAPVKNRTGILLCCLDDFLGQLRRADLAERGGKDQIDVAPDNFRKRLLGVVPCVAREQFQIGVAHVQRNITAGPQNTPKNLARGVT